MTALLLHKLGDPHTEMQSLTKLSSGIFKDITIIPENLRKILPETINLVKILKKLLHKN